MRVSLFIDPSEAQVRRAMPWAPHAANCIRERYAPAGPKDGPGPRT